MSNPFERIKGRFGRKPVPPPPAPAPRSPESLLLDASDDCDAAAAMLAEALAARRKALVALSAATPIDAKGLVNRQMGTWAVGRSLAFHGMGEAIGLPYVASFHRGSFGAAARVLVGTTGRAQPKTPAPAVPAFAEEAA